ncbi:MAG: hypothetical protein HOP18_21840 [Deltaproteobacteria bacterium]|nr:hypothetical protein [Deltaproteobacteria bacterium]
MPTPIESVTFWINAFLPWSLSGATTVLQIGSSRGHSAIIGPRQSCLTDQRGFSTVMTAKSRMHSAITVNFGDTMPVLTQQHRCDYTTECDRETGEVTARAKASTANMRFRLVSSEPIVTIQMSGLTSNPCTSSSWAFGDIEYKGTIFIDPTARGIAVDLMTGTFPAFEGYAAINDGIGSTLFRMMPPAGIKAMHVVPGTTRLIRAQLEDRDGDGVFE